MQKSDAEIGAYVRKAIEKVEGLDDVELTASVLGRVTAFMTAWPAAAARIRKMRAQKKSYDAIARALMQGGYLTVQGRKSWNVGTVWRICNGVSMRPGGAKYGESR